MNKILPTALIILTMQFIPLQSKEVTLSFDEIKSEIARLENAIKSEENEIKKGELLYKLAQVYQADQEIDKAFKAFLSALKYAPTRQEGTLSEGEKKLYEEAFGYYIAQSGNDPARVAKDMLQTYEPVIKNKKDFLHLNFLLSTAYANLGAYDTFFELFFHSYPCFKDSFLAYKTQGILYLRLSQRGRSEEERRCFQEEALRHLTLALDRNPKDLSLYKVLVFLAKDQENDSLTHLYLQKIVENEAQIPRSDIYLYVREAVALGDYELGQEIINQAKAVYEYSRAISAAQEYLNQHRG